MKYEKVHGIYKKLLVVQDIDPTLVSITASAEKNQFLYLCIYRILSRNFRESVIDVNLNSNIYTLINIYLTNRKLQIF